MVCTTVTTGPVVVFGGPICTEVIGGVIFVVEIQVEVNLGPKDPPLQDKVLEGSFEAWPGKQVTNESRTCSSTFISAYTFATRLFV